MKKPSLVFLFLFVLCLCNLANAQTKNVYNSKLEEPDQLTQKLDELEWQKGRFITTNGEVFGNLYLTYNPYNGKVLYLKEGKAYEPTADVNEFHVFDENNSATVYRKGFPPVDGNTLDTYYRVLCDKCEDRLLKRIVKSVPPELNANYYSRQTEVKVEESYYVYRSAIGKMDGFVKTKKSFESALGEKGEKVSEWMKGKKLKVKDDVALVEAFTFYCTLK